LLAQLGKGPGYLSKLFSKLLSEQPSKRLSRLEILISTEYSTTTKFSSSILLCRGWSHITYFQRLNYINNVVRRAETADGCCKPLICYSYPKPSTPSHLQLVWHSLHSRTHTPQDNKLSFGALRRSKRQQITTARHTNCCIRPSLTTAYIISPDGRSAIWSYIHRPGVLKPLLSCFFFFFPRWILFSSPATILYIECSSGIESSRRDHHRS
jgi:hypothetical protein